jgi:uracil-DNA glycosylase family 4
MSKVDNHQRAEYLRALGVDVWVRRSLAATTLDQKVTVPTTEAINPTSAISSFQPGSDASSPISPASFDWPELEAAVNSCTQCELHRTRKQAVFGVGDRRAKWMVIGEAPGAEEDAQGEPFVGRAGQLLNSMLKATGLRRDEVFIANVMKCRPPQNRDPTPRETACCKPFLYRQIELVNPRLILCVGRIAAQNLLDTDTPIGKLRGQVHQLGAAKRPVVVTYHPAYLLRSPGEKRRAWEDLVLAMNTFGSVK